MEETQPTTERPKRNDPCTLRARGGDPESVDESKRPTRPDKLCLSMLHVLSEHDYVQVESVGPVALNVVLSAFRMAAREAEKRTHGSVLVLRQSEYTAMIGGKPTKGLCSRIFAIPVKDAV